jgi:hypothetical protein
MITRRLSLKRKRDLCGDDEEQEVSTKVAGRRSAAKISALLMGAQIILK